MKKVKLNILGLSYSQTQTGAYALILSEIDGNRRIPIIIGSVEAQSIAIQLEGLKPPRPLTHDLFQNVANSFNIDIVEVYIHNLQEGIFYAQIVCKQENNVVSIDSRTSDAVALALRFGSPIYTTNEILEKAGIILEFENPNEETEKEEHKTISKSASEFENKTIEELNDLLEIAITNEDYENASKLSAAIKMRKNK